MTDDPRKQALEIKVADGVLTITIGVEALCVAATRGPYFDDIVNEADGEEIIITDAGVFADAIVQELDREEEDGTTLLHKAFDKAAELAIEGGAEGIRLPGDGA